MTTATRDPVLPNVPTVAEASVPGFEASAWWGVLAPAKTPRAIVARMNAGLAKILRDPQIAERLGGQGMNIVASSPETFSKFIDDQATKWARVVREHGIKAGD